jgi:hypothetical protein
LHRSPRSSETRFAQATTTNDIVPNRGGIVTRFSSFPQISHDFVTFFALGSATLLLVFSAKDKLVSHQQKGEAIMVSVRKQVVIACLDCESAIELSYRPVNGQIISCPHCDVELEVINTNPMELDYYYEEWDDTDEAESSDDADEYGAWDDYGNS